MEKMKKLLPAIAAVLLFSMGAQAQNWQQVHILYKAGMYAEALHQLGTDDSRDAQAYRALCALQLRTENATAQAELCGDGWLVDVQPAWDSPQGAWFFNPLVPSIVDSLEAAYARGRGRSQKAIDFAAQYDADRVFDEYWRPALDVLLAP